MADVQTTYRRLEVSKRSDEWLSSDTSIIHFVREELVQDLFGFCLTSSPGASNSSEGSIELSPAALIASSQSTISNPRPVCSWTIAPFSVTLPVLLLMMTMRVAQTSIYKSSFSLRLGWGAKLDWEYAPAWFPRASC